MGISQVAYAELGVADIEDCVGFHVDVLGMTELGREDGTVKLGCGIDKTCDLTLVQGHAGVHRFALRADSTDDLDHYAKRLAEAGVAHNTHTDREPGASHALRFQLPSGHTMELVVPEPGPIYLNPAFAAHRSGIRPPRF